MLTNEQIRRAVNDVLTPEEMNVIRRALDVYGESVMNDPEGWDYSKGGAMELYHRTTSLLKKLFGD